MAHDVTLTINAACQGESGNVDNGGTVIFNCAPDSATISYSPPDAFLGKTSPLQLHNGSNSYNVGVSDTTITYSVGDCSPQAPGQRVRAMQSGGYTIKVGS